MKQTEHQMSYSKFAFMAAISFVIMYLAMFLNVDQISHVFFSLNRLYMALLMVAPMQILMLLFMSKMYPQKKINRLIMISSAAIFVFGLIALRTQAFIGDRQYMKGMIPHHSSAIMTSKNTNITDPDVKRLSDQIIKSQEEEIAEMKSKLKQTE